MPQSKRKDLALNASAISPEERARRQKAIDTANRSIRLEGFALDAETEALNRRYIDGEITSHEHSEAIRRSAGR